MAQPGTKQRHDTPERREAIKVATFEALIQKPPERYDHYVCLDPSIVDRVDDAMRSLAEAEMNERTYGANGTMSVKQQLATKVAEARKELDDARQAERDSTVVMHFESISPLAYDDLISANKPTEAQLKDAPAGALAWNPETFSLALIAATCVEPKLSVAQLRQMRESPNWSSAQFSELYNCAQRVCSRLRVADVGKG
jgi:hypothetical protein